MTAVKAEGDEAGGAWAQSTKLAFRFLFVAVWLAAVGWCLSGIRQVPPESQALVYRFGTIVRQQGAGLLLAWPRPIEQVVVLPSADRQIQFQIDEFKPAETPNTNFSLSSAARDNVAFLLTGDASVVHLRSTLFYQIVDPAAYVLAAEHVAPALRRLFIASTVSVCAARDLDTILVARPELADGSNAASHAGRERLRVDLMNAINRRLAELTSVGAGLGIVVSRIDLAASVSGDAKKAFDQVLIASQQAERDVAQARTLAANTALGANKDYDRIRTEADAKATERVTKAQTRTAEINALAQGAPGLSVTMLMSRIYFDRIGAVLAKATRVDTVDHDSGINLILPGPGPQ